MKPKTVTFAPLTGILLGRAAPGTGRSHDFRVVLNSAITEGFARGPMPGWKQFRVDMTSDGESNEDLHDQLPQQDYYLDQWTRLTQDVIIPEVGQSVTLNVEDETGFTNGMYICCGPHRRGLKITGTASDQITVLNEVNYAGPVSAGELVGRQVFRESIPEPITHIKEVASTAGSQRRVACTLSRIYADTGAGRNWRILSDGLGDGSYTRWDSAQLGDYVLFTNGINDILAWPINGGTITEGDDAYRVWSVFEPFDLLGLKIERAGCIASWSGFMFLGDVTVNAERIGSRIYWSDYNAPLSWAPGGESSAGYTDLGNGERVLRIVPLMGELRVYTDKAIYAVRLVGGEEIFRFVEIYRGPNALAYRWSLVDTGQAHIYLTASTLVELRANDLAPRSDLNDAWIQLLHEAAGVIFNGVSSNYSSGYTTINNGIGAITATPKDCERVVSGYDSTNQRAWWSWPNGTGNSSLVISTRFGGPSIVDSYFSAFCEGRPVAQETMRDWSVSHNLCDAAEALEYKEGLPLNSEEHGEFTPTCIRNATEDPDLPADPTSLCAYYGDESPDEECRDACSPEMAFEMAATQDSTLKRFAPEVYERDVYTGGQVDAQGYGWMLQFESSQHGYNGDKLVDLSSVSAQTGITVESAVNMAMNMGSGNTPFRLRWDSATEIPIDDQQQYDLEDSTAQEDENLRPLEPMLFNFFQAGLYLAPRLFVVVDDDGSPDYAPSLYPFTVDSVSVRMQANAAEFV